MLGLENDETKKEKWEVSYQNEDNFLFYPNEEIIRFFSKYVKKRTGITNYTNMSNVDNDLKVLDLGCGIGRHVFYVNEMGLDVFGIDLSVNAINFCKKWAISKGLKGLEDKFVQGDITKLPWKENFFNIVISHGVLDSMGFNIAVKAVKEVYRTLDEGGLFYCDLISGDDSWHSREFAGEEIIAGKHEEGTIQSYFNYNKIISLFKNRFKIEELVLIKKENVLRKECNARYHLVMKKISEPLYKGN